MRYFKRYWNKLRGDEHDDWGCSWWFFETDAEGSPYVHMGFHPAWKYKRVVELVFDAGVLKQEFDRSERMAEIREMVSKSLKKESSSETPPEEEIKKFVERAFDRSYRRQGL